MSNKVWYYAVGSEQKGPLGLDELLPLFRSKELASDTYVFTQGMANWVAASTRPEFAAALGGEAAAAMPPAPPTGGSADVIDYQIYGEEMQFVEITLDPREACVAEAGAFMYMDPGIEMQTIFGDGSGQGGGTLFDKFMSAGKRVLTGESLFMTLFGNNAGGRQKVAFASPYPGSIIPVDLPAHGNRLLCQKQSFLVAAKGVSVGIALQRKLGAGLFGGEGFILQQLEGDGLAFLHAGGTVVERTLGAGETMRLDTGCLVAFEQQVSYDIQAVPGIKSKIFGGEGLFYAALTGPGKVWIQSLPFSRLAKQVYAAAPQTGGQRTGEGSILGGLGDLVMGD